ncbi:putative sugar lactone lactonase YvrE [Teleopsis dalmanni]|uniref:putative sugar lactone lactonase YvrE n=1 Tax=Teleopsis dalmanni TaxID=139649 RepID=UPI0018CEDCF1|nr:putative sugar lactone lactonase YvrE [Teleopsis dalmanni]
MLYTSTAQLYVFKCYCHIKISLPLKITTLENTHAELADGPHWRHPNLYYADLGTGNLFRRDTTTNQTFKCKINKENRASFIIPYRNSNDLFVVGLNKKVAQIKWDGRSSQCCIVKVLFQIKSDDAHAFINDGKCAANGALFTGSASCNFTQFDEKLYKYRSGFPEIIKKNISYSNGLVWNNRRNELYQVDSKENTIMQYTFDQKNDLLGKPKVVFKFNNTVESCESSDLVVMDGMTTDSKGHLYVAIFGGKKVIKICSRKWRIMKTYEMPCVAVTSVSFGGPNMDILYVTSAANLFGIRSFPKPCGSVFSVHNIGAKGLKADEFSYA